MSGGLKVLMLGMPTVGKTSFLLRQSQGSFPTDYIPTQTDPVDLHAEHEGEQVTLCFWDHFVQTRDCMYLTCLSMPETSVFVLCVSLVDPESVEYLREEIIPRVKGAVHDPEGWVEGSWDDVGVKVPDAAIVVVGTKLDLVEDEETLERLRGEGKKPVTREDLVELSTEVGAGDEVFMFSSLTGEGIQEMVQGVARAYFTRGAPLRARNKKCVIS